MSMWFGKAQQTKRFLINSLAGGARQSQAAGRPTFLAGPPKLLRL
jgi:hypothetical protein